MKKIILILIAVVFIIGGVTLFKRAQQAKADTPLPKPPAWQVAMVKAKQQQIQQKSTFLARLDAKNSAALASKLSGQISQLLVSENQTVTKGELLVRIDEDEIKASIEGLQATLAAAKSQQHYNKKLLTRNRALFKANTISQDRLEASEVAYKTASAQVAELKQRIKGLKNQLNYTLITAPFDGIIGTVFMRTGDLAIPGKAILMLNSFPQKLTFSFMPPRNNKETKNNLSMIQAEQPVTFDDDVIGNISTLYNDAKAGLWVAEVGLKQRLQQPVGSYLTIEVITHAAQGCAIPLQALLHRKHYQSIMRYDGMRFIEQKVNVLAQDNDIVLIEPCTDSPIAIAAESKLALLPALGENVAVRSATNE